MRFVVFLCKHNACFINVLVVIFCFFRCECFKILLCTDTFKSVLDLIGIIVLSCYTCLTLINPFFPILAGGYLPGSNYDAL